jgi:peptidyl-prolyl cis-trans isomerase SurA
MRIPLLVVVFCMVACTAAPLAGQVIDRIVAVVENDLILDSELSAQIQFYAYSNRIDPKTAGLREKVLETMINEKLVVAKAIEDSITVTDQEVQQQLETVIQQRIAQAGSEARLEELWGMPLNRIKREFRDEMRKNILAQKLQQQRFGSSTIGRYEVEEFYRTYRDSLPRVSEEVDIAHIFLKPKASDAARATARATILALTDSLRKGADFGDLARRHSQDAGTAPLGGELGLVRRGQFVKEFETAVFALEPNQLSAPVETDRGIHLIQLLERRGDAVRARHIMLRIERDPAGDSATVVRLDSIRTAVLGGANFAEMAKKYSEDAESNLIGGSMGTLDLEQMDKSWYATVSPMKEGEISRPAKLEIGNVYGYHIVWVKKRTPPHAMSLEQDYRRLEQFALNNKRAKEYQTWMAELRKSIYWEIRP